MEETCEDLSMSDRFYKPSMGTHISQINMNEKRLLIRDEFMTIAPNFSSWVPRIQNITITSESTMLMIHPTEFCFGVQHLCIHRKHESDQS